MSEPGSDPLEKDLLVVGRILRPHGIRGAVVVEKESDRSDRFCEGSTLLLEKAPGLFEEIRVVTSTPHKGQMLISFSGIDSREDAERLKGLYLMIPVKEAGELAEGEYWVHELIGMTVMSENGERLGEVVDLSDRARQELLTVKRPEGAELLVPFVGEFIIEINRETSTIVVRLIEGMIT